MPSPRFPEPPQAIPATPSAELDRKLERLHSHRQGWLDTGIPERVALLSRCLAGTREVTDAWVADICKLKGIDPNSQAAGEAYLSGPATTVRNIRLLIESLQAGGQKPPPAVTTRPSGQKVARVVPDGLLDRLMFGGVVADVWIEPGKSASQGRIYREKKGDPRVALVLGAGNISSIPPMDLLYKLFAEDEVVLLKMNPVNEITGPHIERAFNCLVEAGVLEVAYGGAEVGAYLADHKLVDTLHVTGSNRTYDAIVWGPDPQEQARRKADNDPVNTRPFTAELGAVTPVMVVPGDWNEKELLFQARHVAAMVGHNASFNCNAGKVLVTAKGWNLQKRFLEAVHEALAKVPPRKAYYPGAKERYQAFIEHYPQATSLGETGPDIVPWTAIPDVPAQAGEYALANEAFCGVLAEVGLESSSPEDFLGAATEFANDQCFGTLSCCLIIDERNQKRHEARLEQALEDLRYGGIGVNLWPGIIYALCSTTWGAFPGHPPSDISSGTGVVHNTFLFDHPQKSVVKGPFMPPITPAYFPDHGALKNLAKALIDMEAKPGASAFLSMAWAGFRG
ncbi:MAG: aldehyde dehydrogenase family protein [Myxococcales bacterium]|nr:aldehyde dehydrogenase family protein [Myxococcales bacterium]